MNWLVDHALAIDILFGIVALGFVVAYRMNQRVKYLAYAGCALVPILLLWLLGRVVVTDQEHIRRTVDAMADAVLAQNADALFRHVAADFSYKGMKRKQMYDAVSRAIRLHRVKTVYISNYRVEKLSRPDGKAHVSFLVRVDDTDGSTVFFARCEADYVLEAEQWKVRGVEFFNPAVNQDQPIAVPLP